MAIDDLWYLAQRADQRAEQALHALRENHSDSDFLSFDRTRHVPRKRFRTLARRVHETGAPYGAHTIVSRPSGEMLLVRHDGVDLWVVPGGGVRADETFREAAERELAEEAGIEATYEGLAMASRVEIRCDEHATWGVLPVFEARAESTELAVDDPDGEISDARWFDTLPPDTRDRDDLVAWRERASG